jgi:hypothetical protein
MTPRRGFLRGALALAGMALAGGRAMAAPRPTVTVHRSPT